MRVIARGTLRDFWRRYPDSEQALKAWYHEAKNAEWRNSADVKARYGTASIVTSERVVFNLCGNKYRLIVHINYGARVVFIRFIGTHKEYNRVDAGTI